jgi:hypothetical protein
MEGTQIIWRHGFKLTIAVQSPVANVNANLFKKMQIIEATKRYNRGGQSQ